MCFNITLDLSLTFNLCKCDKSVVLCKQLLCQSPSEAWAKCCRPRAAGRNSRLNSTFSPDNKLFNVVG